MLKIDVDNKQNYVRVKARGTVPEISTDLIRAVVALREEIANTDDAVAFDFFLRDVFVDIVFASNDMGKVVDILAESILRAWEKDDKDETEHKSD